MPESSKMSLNFLFRGLDLDNWKTDSHEPPSTSSEEVIEGSEDWRCCGLVADENEADGASAQGDDEGADDDANVVVDVAWDVDVFAGDRDVSQLMDWPMAWRRCRMSAGILSAGILISAMSQLGGHSGSFTVLAGPGLGRHKHCSFLNVLDGLKKVEKKKKPISKSDIF